MLETIAKSIFNQPPRLYGWLYIVLIPIFACLYWIIPNLTNIKFNFSTALYFSTVTITTLGYGEIHPLTSLGKFLTAFEALAGITLIGLFLNSLSRSSSEIATEVEKNKQKNEYRRSEKSKLIGHFYLISPIINDYEHIVSELTKPLAARSKSYGKYDPNFKLNDMKDLFKGSLLVKRNFFVPVVKSYYEVLNSLTLEFTDVLKNVDMRLFHPLQDNCLKFILLSHNYDVSENILGATSMHSGGEAWTTTVESALEKYIDTGKPLHGHILMPYSLLLEQIKKQMEVIETIKQEHSKILNEQLCL